MNISPVTTAVLVITGAITFLAFRRQRLQERLMFKPFEILRHKQYDRMLTAGLIHADWIHFAFNAFSFYSFAENIEARYGPLPLLAIYLAAIFGGSLLSLIIHRKEDYSALGASGGVCGVIFASIFLLPGSSIMMFPIPVGIPTIIYAVIFLVGSYWAHRRRADNIGHDAHLGGAIVGLLVATAMYPQLIQAAPGLFATVLILSLIILFLLIRDPLALFGHRSGTHDVPLGSDRAQRYESNRRRNEKMAEVDELLDKVAKRGMHSLSANERKRLETLSKELNG
ncbi:MAG: rhomboid family intramembrane serine protease [Verrucomicrobiota bacterium]